jgi:hypothetical protein
MQKFRKYLPFIFMIAFFLIGLNVFMQSRPSQKNARVYKIVQEFSPYYIDKRFGGLQILNKKDKEFKEKPTNETFFIRFEELEREWGKKHLILNNNSVTIIDENNKTLKSFKLNTPQELKFVKTYYGK